MRARVHGLAASFLLFSFGCNRYIVWIPYFDARSGENSRKMGMGMGEKSSQAIVRREG